MSTARYVCHVLAATLVRLLPRLFPRFPHMPTLPTVFCTCPPPAAQSLEELRLVGNRLKMLPKELGRLRSLRTLAADSNEIVILPGVCRAVACLRRSCCSGSSVPESAPPERLAACCGWPLARLCVPCAGELRNCSALEELTLENNRLTSVLLDFRSLPRLQVGRRWR